MSDLKMAAELELAVRALQKLSPQDCVLALALRIGVTERNTKVTDNNLTDDLMGELFGDVGESLFVIKLEATDPDLDRMMRSIDREIRTATSRPSNHHPSNPRKRK